MSTGSRTTHPHPTLGSVTISRSARSRRISLTVTAAGEVRLTLPIRGSETEAFKFLESRIEWIIAARQRIAQRAAERGVEISAEEIETLRREAKEYLPRRTAELAAMCGFEFGDITIRSARSRWGCCTAANNLSLSLFLMQLPRHLIDFVILHELTHTIHHNHSPRFHATLDRVLSGRERDFIKELKLYRPGFRSRE
ncbi:MAG: YgjP-like metallopeptidase domain-containing protein [Rikenellaceae bacterium]